MNLSEFPVPLQRCGACLSVFVRRALAAFMVVACALAAAAVTSTSASAAEAQPQEGQAQADSRIRSMDALSVVLLRATAPKDARSASTLGAKREGSGIVA